jgi:hypothetical protein
MATTAIERDGQTGVRMTNVSNDAIATKKTQIEAAYEQTATLYVSGAVSSAVDLTPASGQYLTVTQDPTTKELSTNIQGEVKISSGASSGLWEIVDVLVPLTPNREFPRLRLTR